MLLPAGRRFLEVTAIQAIINKLFYVSKIKANPVDGKEGIDKIIKSDQKTKIWTQKEPEKLIEASAENVRSKEKFRVGLLAPDTQVSATTPGHSVPQRISFSLSQKPLRQALLFPVCFQVTEVLRLFPSTKHCKQTEKFLKPEPVHLTYKETVRPHTTEILRPMRSYHHQSTDFPRTGLSVGAGTNSK